MDNETITEPIVKPLIPFVAPVGKPPVVFLVLAVVVVVLGGVSGWGINRLSAKNGSGVPTVGGKAVETVNTATEEGVKDASAFPDTATGNLKENDGKLTTEGSHVLVRGAASQNVYLTSSVIDLSKYVDKKVQIWGQTYSSKKAGWLMDVGRIKLVQ